MKTKLFLLCAITMTFLKLNAQLKVDQNGRIGFGTNTTHPDFIAYMKGNLVLTNYPNANHSSFIFKVGNGWPYAELGNSSFTGGVAFWTSWNGFNKIYIRKYYEMSDSKYKFNITKISSPLKKLNSLKAYQYNYRTVSYNEYNIEDSVVTLSPEYGFLSQEVESVLNEVKITEEVKGDKLLNYTQLIPLLVAAVQDQNKQIVQLQAMTALMMATNPNFSSAPGNGQPETNRLLSGSPNQFSSSTQLRYNLLSETTDAVMKIYDMKGGLIKEMVLSTVAGNEQTLLRSSDLGVKGQYVYALFINGSIVDAKTIVYQ